MFPHVYSRRVSYDERTEHQSIAGCVCTFILVITAIVLLVVYQIPVINNENPRMVEHVLPLDPNTVYKYSNHTGLVLTLFNASGL